MNKYVLPNCKLATPECSAMTFSLSSEQVKKYKEFCKEHCECGSFVDIQFTYTGIGIGISLRCSVCGKVKDITDYDSW